MDDSSKLGLAICFVAFDVLIFQYWVLLSNIGAPFVLLLLIIHVFLLYQTKNLNVINSAIRPTKQINNSNFILESP